MMVYDRNKLPIYPSSFVARDHLTKGSQPLEALMTCRKNPKLQLCRQHFPLKALSINQPTKYSDSK